MKKKAILIGFILIIALSSVVYASRYVNDGDIGFFIDVALNQSTTIDNSTYYFNSSLTGDGIYLYNDSDTMYLNETKLNATIDARALGGSVNDTDNYTTSIEFKKVGSTVTLYLNQTSGLSQLTSAFTDTDTDTTYTAGGTLLDLTGTVFSLNEGTLTDGKICTYNSTISGLQCTYDDQVGAGGTSIWIDAGTYAILNSSYADNVVVNGYIKSLDWSNISITESQISNLLHTTSLPYANITGIPGVSLQGENITSGTIADARLSLNVTKLGSIIEQAELGGLTLPFANITGFTGVTNIPISNITVGTFSGGWTWNGNIIVSTYIGSHTHDATNITSGTLGSARLSGSYTGITGVGTITTGTWTANKVTSGYLGSHVHSGENITSGTIADARLSSNVTKLGGTIEQSEISGLSIPVANLTGTITDAQLSNDVTVNSTTYVETDGSIYTSSGNIYLTQGQWICLTWDCSKNITTNLTGVIING